MRQNYAPMWAALLLFALLAAVFSGCAGDASSTDLPVPSAASIPPAAPVSLPLPASGGDTANSDGGQAENGENSAVPRANALPEGFVYVDEVVPGVVLDIRYSGEHNFVGAPIDGYEAPLAILRAEAAGALKAAAGLLAEQGYALKIFDAYRPVRAVAFFA